jgi:hypothetical protein
VETAARSNALARDWSELARVERTVEFWPLVGIAEKTRGWPIFIVVLVIPYSRNQYSPRRANSWTPHHFLESTDLRERLFETRSTCRSPDCGIAHGSISCSFTVVGGEA